MSDLKPPQYQNYLNSLTLISPILFFGIFLSVQLIVLLIILRPHENPLITLLKTIKPSWIVVFLFILILFIISKLSGFGFVPYTNRWIVYLEHGKLRPLGSVLIWEQLIIIILAFVVLIALYSKVKGDRLKKISIPSELIIIVIIWFCTYLIWRSIPLQSNYFVDISGFPNNRIYPISDAFYFDNEAFRILDIGQFSNRMTHVLYSFFLSILHWIGGPGYQDIIGYQLVLLASIPVLLYKLVSKLHTRITGLFVASLFILRERNGLLLANTLNTTLVNQLMTESFAILGILGFMYLFFDWLYEKNPESNTPLLIGGVMGLSLLVRAELLVVLIVFSCGALVYLWHDKKRWLHGMLQIWAITGIIIIPWMARNYTQTGVFSLDKGDFVKGRLTQLRESVVSAEGGEQFVLSEYDFATAYPMLFAYTPEVEDVVNHLVNGVWQSILYLPSSHQPLFTLFSLSPLELIDYQREQGFFSENYVDRYIRSLPYYRYDWDNTLEPRSIISIGFVLLFISVGIWKLGSRDRVGVMILILALLSHIFIYAVAGYSGGRFIKPIDWITMVFYGIGIVELISNFVYKFEIGGDKIRELLRSDSTHLIRLKKSPQSKKTFLVTFLFILIGLAPVVSELILPNKYNNKSKKQVLFDINRFEEAKYYQRNQCYVEEIQQSDQHVIFGKALYPRFYLASEALPDDQLGTMPDPLDSRIDFYLLSEQPIWVSISLENQTQPFPHYSDVIVIGKNVRYSEEDRLAGKEPYFLASEIYIIDTSSIDNQISKLSINGSDCDTKN